MFAFSDSLAWMLRTLSAENVTDLFIGTILLVGIVCFVLYLVGWFRKLTTYTPSLLTSLGILGTSPASLLA